MSPPDFKDRLTGRIKRHIPRALRDTLIRGEHYLSGGLQKQRVESKAPLDIVIGGVPRSGTTVAAKFLSLHEDIFCYAGETHILPTLHSFFSIAPCHPRKRALLARYFKQTMHASLYEVPRYSVSRGAHKGNVIFDETDVDRLVGWIEAEMRAGTYGAPFYHAGLAMLRALLGGASGRALLGEKTPTNIFAMAQATAPDNVFHLSVVREPFGVVRSMQARVEGGDAYSGVFDGGVEANIGIYLEFTRAVIDSLEQANGMLVRYEEIARDPEQLITNMMGAFGKTPEERVLQFVKGDGKKFDHEIADRAPMMYQRLHLRSHADRFSPVERWKIINLTRQTRIQAGYDDETLRDMDLFVEQEWPLDEIPAIVLPLWGFHSPVPGTEPVWMKKKASLVVYIPKGTKPRVHLSFRSQYPGYMADYKKQGLRVHAGNRLVDEVEVATGSQRVELEVEFEPGELSEIGSHGHFALIDLQASSAWIPFVHTRDSEDARELSFRLDDWKIG